MSAEAKYYWIDCSEDGDVRVHVYTKKELEIELDRSARAVDDGESAPIFSRTLPGADPQYWDGKSIIIKGEIVVPSPRDVVQKWELP